MAARLNPRNQQAAREKIRATQLINRLQNYALAEVDEDSPGMSKGQVTAALGLLKKCVPDLVNTQLTGEGDEPIKIALVERRIVKAGAA